MRYTAMTVLCGLAVFTVLVSGVLSQGSTCPHRCLCFRTTVRCMFLHLEHVPRVPPDTTILDLRFNKIRNIPRGSFSNLHRLNTLLLNNNEIAHLDDGAFQGLRQLRYLYLYKNKIEVIKSKVFHDLPKLEQLFLHNNRIKRLPKGVFSTTKHLHRLRLDSNALVCDCELIWLSDMLKEKHGYTQAAATCEFPSSLQGRSLMSISKHDFHCKKPRFTMEPRDVDVTFGNTAYFTCRAEGSPIPEISWFHNNNEISAQDARYSILSDGTLMIQETKDTDQGVYECVAKNAAGEVKTNQVELRYFGEPEKPKFMEMPDDVTAVAGRSITLPCRAIGNPRPDITWTKNGRALRISRRYSLLANGALSITNLQVEDRGLYRCRAANSVNAISASARVTVQVSPSFIVKPQDVLVLEGHTANFICTAEGDPTPILIWTKDGRPLRNTRRYQISDGGGQLSILSTDPDDEGTYRCKAENAAGMANTSAELKIIPNVAPSFREEQLETTASTGSDITFDCSALGTPEPQIRWQKEGRRIHTSSKFVIEGHRLTIQNVQLSDSGTYSCAAVNSAGRAVRSISLLVQGVSSPSRPGDRFVSGAIHNATNSVNRAINNTVLQLFNRSRTHSVQDLMMIFRYPAPEALELARAEEIFEQTLEIITNHVRQGHAYNLEGHEATYRELVSPSHLALIADMSGCNRQSRTIDCSDTCFHHKYRTHDGTCNNQINPTWGASNRAFDRLVDPIYENGFNTPVGWNRARLYNGNQLPSPRLVSSLMMSSSHVTEDEKNTHMLMQWGQFLDHDMDLTPQSISYSRFSDGRRCNETCENQSPCFPIPVPNSDLRIHSQCLGFARSSATCNSGTTSIFFNTVSPRQQINVLTSFIDASQIYGSTAREAEHLRELSTGRGLLRQGPITIHGTRYLPFDDHTLADVDCQIESSNRHVPCFLAGDHRANEHLALTAMHTLWYREHNRVATMFRQLNPHWDGNKIYHTTKKLLGAMIQHISYSHWLPNILGNKGMGIMGPYKGYDPNVNPTIVNEFATAAFRFGHSLVQPIIFRLNETFHPISEGNLPLHKAFFSPYRIMEEGGIDPLLRGLFGVAAKKRMPSEYLNSELTEKLFALSNAIGQDLASLNVQRGRDHGLPFYNSYRKFCNLTVATSFNGFRREIKDRDTRQKLQALYGSPDNVDLFVGGMAETPIDGAKIGPTFVCLLSDQFKRLRDGDRFWYENPSIFPMEQVAQIRRASLARVICDNSDSIDRVQKNVFMMTKSDDEYINCDNIPRVDLRMWTDCCEDCRRSNRPQSFTRRFRGRRSAEFSYPEDRPEPELMVNGSEHTITVVEHPKLEVDVKTERDHREFDDGWTARNLSESVKKDVFQLDSRIEGMEAALEEMSNTMFQLQKKMRYLYRLVKGKVGLHCRSANRRKHVHGSKWKVDKCKTCTCKKGQIECTQKTCPVPDCESPTEIEGQCCPVCQ
ncbi:peroxidasin-like isoform X2 [Gigantopelta aegis]|uniref:peroxidasin-like isoform X2 n=1 Tax=Gigantopelta aegis TaxID=1735272 RepID=UPI001B889DF8|nr:peroxidasin-like isoform X2 [Gigantopelta aegis]